MGHIPTMSKDGVSDQWMQKTAGALSLLLFAPFFVIALLWSIIEYNGSVFVLLTRFGEFTEVVAKLSKDTDMLAFCGKSVVAFSIFEAILFAFLPGTVFDGPVTPGGVRPKYRDNGFLAFWVTNGVLIAFNGTLFPILAELARNHLSLIVVMNVSALIICLVMFVKGIFFPAFAPPDSGRTGNGIIFDYYWGTELHPRFSADSLFDLKQWVNCRIGMMGWSVLLTAFYLAHSEANAGVVSNAVKVCFWLQQIYIAKFFLWERGYMASIDIAHDRFGFYIAWGCLVWLPSLYPSGLFYLYHHTKFNTIDIPTNLAIATVLAGIACVVITYLADEQRQQVRKDDGKVKVWGSLPKIIRAKYVSSDGKTHDSILVCAGWWSIARHFHYVTEWGGAFLWTLPVAWVPGAGLLAWTYPIFLAILLFHRSVRDEERCSEKYGKYWKEYSKAVPWRIFPGIF